MSANPNNQDPKGVPEQTLAPHEICPEGTKVWMLCLGWLEADDAFLVRGANISLKSTEGESFVNKRRKLPMYCVLIEHPTAGLILWETGGDKVGNGLCDRLQEGEERADSRALPISPAGLAQDRQCRSMSEGPDHYLTTLSSPDSVASTSTTSCEPRVCACRSRLLHVLTRPDPFPSPAHE